METSDLLVSLAIELAEGLPVHSINLSLSWMASNSRAIALRRQIACFRACEGQSFRSEEESTVWKGGILSREMFRN